MKRIAFLLVALATWPVRAAEPAKPNIIIFLADDLGARDLGCYGSTFHDTPHLDRMAQDGMKFTNAYAACPVCSPTRAALLTGRWPQRTGITDFIGAAQPIREVFEPRDDFATRTAAARAAARSGSEPPRLVIPGERVLSRAVSSEGR